MNQYDIYNYVYDMLSNCFQSFFITRITINNYIYCNYKKDKKPDLKVSPLYTENYEQECNVFDLIDITNNTKDIYKQNINSRLTCFECKSKIFGEIFMFDDKPFCRKFCRKKSMDKLIHF